MSEKYGNFASPATEAAAITPSDTVNIPTGPTRGVYVGVTGNVTVVMAEGAQTAVLFVAVPAGTILPISVKRVNATGTAATDLVALF